jgi:radical SAM modification target selenobiotic family peptide
MIGRATGKYGIPEGSLIEIFLIVSEGNMDLKELKKALAGVCVASLLSGAGLTYAGSGTEQSGAQSGEAGMVPQKKEAGKTG